VKTLAGYTTQPSTTDPGLHGILVAGNGAYPPRQDRCCVQPRAAPDRQPTGSTYDFGRDLGLKPQPSVSNGTYAYARSALSGPSSMWRREMTDEWHSARLAFSGGEMQDDKPK